MTKIWEKITSPNEYTSINELAKDTNNHLLIFKALGQRFLNKEDLFICDPSGQIMLMIANAPFIKSEQEGIQITHIVKWAVNRIDIFPMISEHKNQDLAYRCLISLGFFKSAMEKRTKKLGTPSISFYRQIGINTFKQMGYQEISEDFIKWECYLGEISC